MLPKVHTTGFPDSVPCSFKDYLFIDRATKKQVQILVKTFSPARADKLKASAQLVLIGSMVSLWPPSRLLPAYPPTLVRSKDKSKEHQI